jgi:hypothetical protein
MGFGFGFFLGIFLVAWGGFGIAQYYGYLPKDLGFPMFPAIIVLIGLWLVFRKNRFA